MEVAEEQKSEKSLKKKIIEILLWVPILIWKFMRRVFNRLKYKIVYKWRVKDFLFINYWVLGALGVVVAVLYRILDKGPVYIAIPSLTTELYITESTLRTVSIFIGIVFSFIVLSFNVFYKYFGRFAFVQFFTSRYIKFIFTLFIGDMMLLIYTCGYLKEGNVKNAYGDSLFIFSLIVSIILVLSIIPTLILLLRSSQNRDNIRQLIRQFNTDWSISYHVNVLWKEGNEQTHNQRDPITLLIEIGTAAIKDFDRISIIAIREGCITHLKKLHSDYQIKPEFHPDVFYHKLYELTRNLFPVAIKERNELAALIIVKFHLEIEEFYMKNFKDFNVYESTDHYYEGIGFNVVMKEFLLKALQFNEDAVSEEIISSLREWWTMVIDFYLPGIAYDYPKDKPFAADKTSFFISSTYYTLDGIFQQIFTYKKLFLFKEIAMFFGVINAEIVGSKNTRNTVVHLLQTNGSYMASIFEKFVNLTDSEISSEVYPFGLATTQELSDIGSQVPLQYELRVFEYLFKQNKLNAYVINMIKAIAYHTMGHFKEDAGYKKALLSVIEKFDYLRGFVSENACDKQKETYLLLERYLGYIQEWTSKYEISDPDVLSTLSSALGHFELKEKFTQELDTRGYTIRDVR